MNNKSCCFTGHRDLPQNLIPAIKEKLKTQLIKLTEEGFTDFYAGGAIGFDTLAALCVLELKKEYPHIRLHIIIPCADQTKSWDEKNKLIYQEIRDAADEALCLSPVYFNGCMMVRNRYMVDASSVLIAYLTKNSGGSASTVKYAESKKLHIINIADSFN